MHVQSRLKKLESLKLRLMIDTACICFPVDEQPCLYLQAEREAASAVLCPLHGRRFSKFDCKIFRAFVKPTQLEGVLRGCSKQYRKAIEASFPPDRWPPTAVVGPGPVVRYLLRDGAEIYRYFLPAVYDDNNQPLFENGKQLFVGPTGRTIFLEPASAIPSEESLSDEEKRWRSKETIICWLKP